MLAGQFNGNDHGLLQKFVSFIASSGDSGVVIFFVLSGFLVGGKAIDLFHSTTLDADWPKFLVDRFSRIFVVFWPALAFSAFVLWVVCTLAPAAPFVAGQNWGVALYRPLNADLSVRTWLGAACLVNDFFTPLLQVNGPIWSLACEWFYYISALAVVLVMRRAVTPGALVIVAYAVILLALGFLHDHRAIQLSSVWLMGVGAKIVFDRGFVSGLPMKLIAFALLVLVLTKDQNNHIADIALGAAAALLIANKDWASWRFGEGWSSKLAEFSYSLYLTHFPVTILALTMVYKICHHGIQNLWNPIAPARRIRDARSCRCGPHRIDNFRPAFYPGDRGPHSATAQHPVAAARTQAKTTGNNMSMKIILDL